MLKYYIHFKKMNFAFFVPKKVQTEEQELKTEKLFNLNTLYPFL